ncbi:hypothetical protein PAXRUDRAFT_36506 [Paxillus rubicundulus Ve08.2h10]|uniref:Cytochrome P450 n=1 Tax=Paxillus rubicundulus Ve08.2h10 TaxID=930991 RepID=A0A0D0C864_9AGAM|nr:hypothetical protein PAXRUDRAFT_36506 [Paxillus rubicundulus Ve08.2h10]
MSPSLLFATLCFIFLVVHLGKRGKLAHKSFPMGLRQSRYSSILGNIRGTDTRYPWRTYAKWDSDDGVAQDLLDRQSQNYSSRPASLVPINELHFTSSFRPIRIQKAHDLIRNLLSAPNNFPTYLHILGTSTIMAVVYDYKVTGTDGPIVAHVGRAIDIGVNELRPSVAAVIAAFPFYEYSIYSPLTRKHLPPWFPGANFKRSALISQKIIVEWVEPPFQYVKRTLAVGIAAPSMVSETLLRIQDKAGTEEEAAYPKKAVKEACAKTTLSTLFVFILSMVLYPGVQAQTEIDSVTGSGLLRLPDWEIGYHIPKGATVRFNAWEMSSDPEKFLPERFLSPEKGTSIVDPSFAFRFGRCIWHVADASLWISIVSMLAVFQFEPAPSWDARPDRMEK